MAFYSDGFNYKKATDTTIERFICGVYFVEIVETPKEFEAWLRHKDYCVSMLMFGGDKENLLETSVMRHEDFCSEKDEAQFLKRRFLAHVRCNLYSYIKQYNEDYVDESEE